MNINYEKPGNRLQAQRKTEGITQAKSAEALMMSEGLISGMEYGKQSAALEIYGEVRCN